MRPAVVVAGGDPPDPSVAALLPTSGYVVAADRGLDHALALGLTVDLAVGDFDSADPQVVAAARDRGVPFQRHPAAKDATDLELALDAALATDPDRIIVVGAGGGRLDHLFGVALLLAAPAYAAVPVSAHLGSARVWVVRGDPGAEVDLDGEPGAYLSLLPVHGPARGITTTGLRFPLHDEDLGPGTTRGVSNEFLATAASVRVRAGVLLAVRP